jgi:hypothetical protein
MRFFNFNKSLFKRKHIFDDISGYEEEKWVLEQTLNNVYVKSKILKSQSISFCEIGQVT